MVLRWPGQTAADKKRKIEILQMCFGTNSWTEIETRVDIDRLKAGLIKVELFPIEGQEEAANA